MASVTVEIDLDDISTFDLIGELSSRMLDGHEVDVLVGLLDEHSDSIRIQTDNLVEQMKLEVLLDKADNMSLLQVEQLFT